MDIEAAAYSTGDVYFIYDGACPVCHYAAHAFRVRQAVGQVHLINAREVDSPLVAEVSVRGYDLDAGMVIMFGGRYYHGADALVLMALLSTRTGWFNRINAMVFRSQTLARLFYPAMRVARNLLIRAKAVPKLNNLAGMQP